MTARRQGSPKPILLQSSDACSVAVHAQAACALLGERLPGDIGDHDVARPDLFRLARSPCSGHGESKRGSRVDLRIAKLAEKRRDPLSAIGLIYCTVLQHAAFRTIADHRHLDDAGRVAASAGSRPRNGTWRCRHSFYESVLLRQSATLMPAPTTRRGNAHRWPHLRQYRAPPSVDK